MKEGLGPELPDDLTVFGLHPAEPSDDMPRANHPGGSPYSSPIFYRRKALCPRGTIWAFG